MNLLETLFLLGLLPLALAVAVFALQIVAALPAWREPSGALPERPSIAVLVPAHDEAGGIAQCLRTIGAQLHDGDRLLVIADNCSDETGAVARAAGAEVVERHDGTRRGKGYALDFGVRHLASAPRQVVIMIDADCLLHFGALERLAGLCTQRQRPVQARYLMHARTGAAPLRRVAEFAWLLKNWLRPLGGSRLGMPCQLMGSGMAFTWQMLERAPLASAHIVEDLMLGLDFAAAGQAPVFCPEAYVSSIFPDNAEGSRSQRTRWEHGHLSVILKHGPRLWWKSCLARDRDLFSMALDLCVPPLSLLILCTLGASIAAIAGFWVSAAAWPWALAWLLPPVLFGALLAGWLKAGRNIVPLHCLAYAAWYVLQKIPLYVAFVVRRQAAWISSVRDKP